MKVFTKRSKYHLAVLLFIFVCLQAFFFVKKGVQTGPDTVFYLENAQRLLEFKGIENRAYAYFSFIALLAINLLVSTSGETIVLFNIAANAIALVCIYYTVRKLTGNDILALVATLYYLAWYKFYEWNTFIVKYERSIPF